MAQTHVMSALIEKRREMAGQIEHHQKQVSAIKAMLATIDQAIKIFDPDFNLHEVKPKRVRSLNQHFAHGEASRLLMDLMREAGRELTTTEIVEEAARRKGIELAAVQRRPFTASIFTTLKRFEKRGVIEQTGKDGMVAVWKLA